MFDALKFIIPIFLFIAKASYNNVGQIQSLWKHLKFFCMLEKLFVYKN